jgi:hypothetical protein
MNLYLKLGHAYALLMGTLPLSMITLSDISSPGKNMLLRQKREWVKEW